MENYYQSIADSRYCRTRNTRSQRVLLNRKIQSCESELQSLKNSLEDCKARHESLKAQRREQAKVLKRSCFEISNYRSRALCLAIHRRLPPELRVMIYEEYWRLSATETTKVNCIEPIAASPLPIPDPISAIWTFDRWQRAYIIPTKLLERAASEEIVGAMYRTLDFAFNGSPRELEVALSCDTFGWSVIPRHHIKSISVFINRNFNSKRDFMGLTEASVRRTTNILLSMDYISKLKVEVLFAARVSGGWEDMIGYFNLLESLYRRLIEAKASVKILWYERSIIEATACVCAIEGAFEVPEGERLAWLNQQRPLVTDR